MKKYSASLMFIVGLALGTFGTVLYQKYEMQKNPAQLMEDFSKSISSKNLDDFYDKFFDDSFFKDNSTPFKQMEKMKQEMSALLKENMKDFPSGDIFDDWYENRFGGKVSDVKQEEDKNSVYYKVYLPNLEKENLKVEVQDGVVNISAEREKVEEEKREDTVTKKSLKQRFERRLPVPSNADGNKVDFRIDGDYLVIQFPKLTKTYDV